MYTHQQIVEAIEAQTGPGLVPADKLLKMVGCVMAGLLTGKTLYAAVSDCLLKATQSSKG